MRRLLSALVTAVLAGCGGCGHANPPRDASVDAPRLDAIDALNADHAAADVDDVPSPAWADGSLLLPRHPAPDPPRYACGAARAILGDTATDAHHECAHDGWLYFDLGAIAGRIDLAGPDGMFETLTPNTADYAYLAGFPRCQTDAIMLLADCAPCRAEAIVRFVDVAQPGTVVWSDVRAPWHSVLEQGGTSEFVASDQLTAWLYAEADSGPQLYVAGPRAESPHVLAVQGPVFDLHADGPHLVFAGASSVDSVIGDIFLWTVGTGAPENLTHDAYVQTWPWISGNRVVWADQRAAPGGGSLGSPNDPDIYGMDLTTRVPFRLNQDAPGVPAVQNYPVIAGDWVVWMDARHATMPNISQFDLADVLEIYGYNWVTGREYPVMAGAIHATIPTIIGSDVYFGCRSTASGGPPPSLFATPLPTP